MNKCLIAMSGGVDSAVAALLVKSMNIECIGATMKLLGGGGIELDEEHACCSREDIEDAKKVAEGLGIEHYLYDFSEHFAQRVVDNFVRAYETGATPNPCIECNRYLKFQRLFEEAENLGCSHIATGHYARVEYNEENGIVPQTIIKKVHDNIEITKAVEVEEKVPEIAIVDIGKEIEKLKGQMQAAAYELKFELAAQLRDKIKELEARLHGDE